MPISLPREIEREGIIFLIEGEERRSVRILLYYSETHPGLSFLFTNPCRTSLEQKTVIHNPPYSIIRFPKPIKAGYYVISVDGDERVYPTLSGQEYLIIGFHGSIYEGFDLDSPV